PAFRHPSDGPAPAATPRSSSAGHQEDAGQPRGTVWVPEGKFVRSLPVTTGLTDGTLTEIEGPTLAEHLQVVVGEQGPETARMASDGVNPFTPQLGQARGRGSR